MSHPDTNAFVEQLQKLEQQSRRSLPFFAVSILSVVVSLGYSAYKLNQLQVTAAQLTVEAEKRSKDIEILKSTESDLKKKMDSDMIQSKALQSQKKQLSEEIASLQQALAKAKTALDSAGQKNASQELGTALIQSKSTVAKIGLKGIIIELEAPLDGSDDNEVNAVASDLKQMGYTVAPIIHTRQAPDTVEVRYYHVAEDKPLAGRFMDLLKSRYGAEPIRISLVDDPEPPLHFLQISFPQKAHFANFNGGVPKR